jgi:hypothetical protein
MPCEDPERVDEWRAELGMTQLAYYLALFPSETGEVRTLEAALRDDSAD